MNGENEMTNNDESRSLRIIAFAVPVKVATATRLWLTKIYAR